MKTIYFLRHAHAEPVNSSFSDFDRPLNEKGREEADAVSTYLGDKRITFDFVICSAALRTQETFEPLRSLVRTQQIEVSENFYNISEEKIKDHLQSLSNNIKNVLYIGHNPGLAFAILRFAKSFPAFLQEGIHPATLVGFHFLLDKWTDVEWRKGEIIDAFQPTSVPLGSLAPKGP